VMKGLEVVGFMKAPVVCIFVVVRSIIFFIGRALWLVPKKAHG